LWLLSFQNVNLKPNCPATGQRCARLARMWMPVASALYGSSALGGVINLISRRPEQAEHELLINRASREGADAVFRLTHHPAGNIENIFVG
jgi:hypothetical protein